LVGVADFTKLPGYPKELNDQYIFSIGARAGWSAAFNPAFNESQFKQKAISYTLVSFLIGTVVGYALQFI